MGRGQRMDISVMFNFMTTKLAAPRSRIVCAVRRLLRQQDGAAAVEFGLVAAPFLALLFAIMETALVFFAGQTLETAVADSGRMIMTGEAKAYTKSQFKDAVCAKIKGLFDCQGGLDVDVQTFTSFGNITMTTPALDADGKYVTQFQPGTASAIVVVRVFYKWPVYASLLHFLSNNGKYQLIATSAFRNEPY
jgi:Flp pilus assembly protein TadG